MGGLTGPGSQISLASVLERYIHFKKSKTNLDTTGMSDNFNNNVNITDTTSNITDTTSNITDTTSIITVNNAARMEMVCEVAASKIMAAVRTPQILRTGLELATTGCWLEMYTHFDINNQQTNLKSSTYLTLGMICVPANAKQRL